MIETFCWTPQRRVLTPSQTHIDALPLFGIQSSTRAGLPLKSHTHPNCLELVFLIKGFQCYETQGQLFNLSGYDIYISYPDELHSTGSYPEAIADFIWLQIDLSPDLPFFGLDQAQSSYLRTALLSLPRIFRGDDALKSTLTESFYHLAEADPLLRAYGQQLLVSCLYRILLLSRRLPQTETEDIENAILYIHDHLYEPIQLEKVAASCSLSLSRFKCKFKEKTGSTPRTFINHLKIEQAKVLLRQQNSVTETALSLGFDTPNYFATIFKKYTGQTPAQYKKAGKL